MKEIQATGTRAQIQLIQLDLASLSSVQQAVEHFLIKSNRLDIIIANAGIMAVPPGTTLDGYEIQFGTNYLGHALLVKMLIPTMMKTATQSVGSVRIVALGSDAYKWTPRGGINFSLLHTTQESDNTVARYGQSKLALMLLSRELAARYPAITTVAVHPGLVDTGLSRSAKENSLAIRMLEWIMRPILGVTVKEGVLNQLWAAVSNDVESGSYYVPIGKHEIGSTNLRNVRLAAQLWEWTESELAPYLQIEEMT